MKSKVFFHSRDLDGHFSGIIAKYYFDNIAKQEIELIPFDYGMTLPKIGKEDVYFLDVTPDGYTPLEEINKTNYLVVIDHHKTFLNYLQSNNLALKGYQKEGIAGCELTWQYFFTDLPVPNFITLLGRYDVFDQSEKIKWENEILPFQYGMRMEETDPTKYDSLRKFNYWIDKHIRELKEPDEIKEIIKNGKVILDYQKKEDEKSIKNYSFDIKFNGLNVLCMNSTRFNSQVFESKWDPDKYSIMMNLVLTKGKYYTVSLYTTRKDISCGDIAKKFGGGGHPQAAGFVAKDFYIKDEEIFFKIT